MNSSIHRSSDTETDPSPRTAHALADPSSPGPVRAPDPLRVALCEALATVGDRWTLMIVAALLDGPRRFSELQEEVYGIAPNVLSQRLRHLERRALVISRPYSRRPPRAFYELTTAGLELAGAVRLLAAWGARGREEGAPRHELCGAPVEARWWCPTCERPVEDQELGEVHFA